MKKFYLFLILILVVLVCLNIRCAKINKDTPCGIDQQNQEQLFKSTDSRCYYLDNSGNKVYVDNSNCTCF